VSQERVQWRHLVNKVTNIRGSINGGEFLDQLSDYQLLKRILLYGYRQVHVRCDWGGVAQ
jgi:hypothetical protein